MSELFKLYINLGDRLALQYGGSKAVTAGLVNRGVAWDMMTSMRRFLTNAFMDEERQNTINLFLGYYTPLLTPQFMSDLLPYSFPLRNSEDLDKRKLQLMRATQSYLLSKIGNEDNENDGPISPTSFLNKNSPLTDEDMKVCFGRVVDLWDLESDYYLHSHPLRNQTKELTDWWREAIKQFMDTSIPVEVDPKALIVPKSRRVEDSYYDVVHGPSPTLTFFSSEDGDVCGFGSLDKSVDISVEVHDIASPQQTRLAALWEGKVGNEQCCITELMTENKKQYNCDAELQWEDILSLSGKATRNHRTYQKYCGDMNNFVVDNKAEMERISYMSSYEKLTTPAAIAISETDLQIYNNFSRRRLEAIAENEGDVEAYNRYISCEVDLDEYESGVVDALSSAYLDEPPQDLMPLFEKFFQQSLSPLLIWNYIQELIFGLRSGVPLMNRIRHMNVGEVFDNKHSELPEMMRGDIYYNSFLGKQAVTWLVDNCHKYGLISMDRLESEEFLALLLKTHAFHHVMHAYSLRDGYFYIVSWRTRRRGY
eukprot:NODE_254_length_3137_cov_47.109157_g219_i0.p1 GENE.NODE_254_length_3137_cov_47.109157_g219_i0~~NODE_254_length_3137_cov_47.109157_g219_i0.p1  ORF type:complete len:622 (-),score=91.43 NODE_254_length_3137_cov_47.109157_g219_i0:1272-2885(-)